MKKVRLKSFSIDENSLLSRFDLRLEDGDWMLFEHTLQETWNNMEFNLEGVIVNHIRNSLEKAGYKAELQDNRLVFKKQESI